MKANPHFYYTHNFIPNDRATDSDLNQIGDLMLLQIPRTSVRDRKNKSSVYSKRRFMVVCWVLKTIIFLIAFLTGTQTVEARKIKTKHSIPKHSEKSIPLKSSELSDSIISLTTDSLTFVDKIIPSIRFYGFDKTVTSNIESFFISNGLEDMLTGLEVEITYFDLKGRQLHKRSVHVDCDIPAGETIRTDIKSWDTQKSFYYHQSVKPKRQATPFNVTIRLLSVKMEGEASRPPL